MNVIFISNCEKKAVSRTRSLIDRYATRIGERAWTTPITEQALDEVMRALRRHASRHTSVACYRNDRVVGMRLIWIVGNRQHYDKEGRFAVSTQQKTKEMPMFIRHAALVAALSGYGHDLGKASVRFQEKLRASRWAGKDAGTPASRDANRDAVRHEWLSAWLMDYILKAGRVDMDGLKSGWDALQNLARGPRDNVKRLDFVSDLGSGLDAVKWAVCTHHGAMGGELAQGPNHAWHVRAESPEWKENLTLEGGKGFDGKGTSDSIGDTEDCARWTHLLKNIHDHAGRIASIDRCRDYWEPVFLAARAALILADHKISSQDYPESGKPGYTDDNILYANTKSLNPPLAAPTSLFVKPSESRGSTKKQSSPTPIRRLDQPLSWHLQSVGDLAAQFVRMIAADDLPCVQRTLVDDVLERRSTPYSPFAWQDVAADATGRMASGGLVFNVAGTGAGKTLGNLKMALAMRRANARLAVAFNLRSLTTQTHAAFGRHIKPMDAAGFHRDFACLLGSRGVAHPDAANQDEDDMDEAAIDDVEGAQALEIPGWLSQLCNRGTPNNLVKLIAAPVLVSTMDWIVAAGEPGQQDRHAKALIRVSTSDLILDEVDSYDVRASVAVMRVVQTAASFGRNVIVSSATLNPELARGIAAAYAAGRRCFQAVSGQGAAAQQDWHMMIVHDDPAMPPVQIKSPCVDKANGFYRERMQAIASQIRSKAATKRYRIVPAPSQDRFFSAVADEAVGLHEQWAAQPAGLACRVSIGLIRVANVSTCMDLAERLRTDGRFTVCAYHAKDLLERRAWREVWMDRILYRGDGQWIEALKEAVPGLDAVTGDVRLIIVATPVEEVGRDHDFDWAIIEPSSMQSVIQTAGRVNRHRRMPIEAGAYNIALLSKNLRALRKPEGRCFVWPGLEAEGKDAKSTHPQHDMQDLMLAALAGEGAGEGGGEGCGEDVLDAGLVFDSDRRKTRFAQYDENSVRQQIDQVLPIIERLPGRAMGLILKAYARDYPLRDSAPPMRYIVHWQECELMLNGIKKTGSVKIEAEQPSGTWLCPPLAAVVQEGRLSLDVSRREKPVTGATVTWNGVKLR